MQNLAASMLQHLHVTSTKREHNIQISVASL
jgi:hypothetical protein